MPSKIWTDDHLEKLLKERASRLAKLVELRAPPIVTSREIGMVVSAARLLFGRETIDTQIDEFQSLTDAREAGICEECFNVLAIPGYSVCAPCMKEGERVCAEMDRKYGSLDDTPQGRTL